MSLIVAIDPGSTTGVAVLRPPLELVGVGEETDRAKVVAWIRRVQPETLVVEDFKPYAGLPTWTPLPAPKLLGILEELGFELVYQSPSIKKRFPDALLKIAELHTPGKPHANDAVRHALYYCWMTQKYLDHPTVQDIYREYIKVRRHRDAGGSATISGGPASSRI